MFKHKALALDGVGFGHKVLAVLGTRWFNVDVIIEPVQSYGGGGYVSGPPIYNVKFVITMKDGKVYSSEHRYTNLGIATLEKVIASFKKATVIMENIQVSAKMIGVKMKNILVRAFKK